MITEILGGVLNLPIWVQMILFVVFIVGGFFALIKGADAFVSGASGIAKKLKVPAIIIGLTIVSIGTSLPEASVSISSAITGSADISISNVVGSNMFNTLVVLAFSLVFVPIALNKSIVLKDMLIMLASAVLLLIFALLGDGENSYILGRIECAVLFALFLIYLIISIVQAKKESKKQENIEKSQENYKKMQEDYEKMQKVVELEEIDKVPDERQKNKSIWKNILMLVVGLAGVIIGGDLVVFGAKNFAINVGMSEVLVGLTIVAIGTSLPELVTSIVASKVGLNEIALGNVIGSNMFNILFILGATGIITPLAVSANVLIDIIIMTALFVCLFIFSLASKKLPKYLGYILLALYAIYLTYIIVRDFVLVA